MKSLEEGYPMIIFSETVTENLAIKKPKTLKPCLEQCMS